MSEQPTLSDLDMLLIERACARLCNAYVRLVDRRADEFADLFAEDARLVLLGFDLTGRAQIRDFVRALPADMVTLHFASNILIDVIDADTAHGTSDMVYFNGPDANGVTVRPTVAPLAIGIYHDVYKRQGGGWVFASRRFQVRFLNEALAGAAGG